MKLKNRWTLRLLVFLIADLFAGTGYATNGYFTHGLGVKDKGMAGAGMASPSEAIGAAVNPASALFVDEKWEVGLSIFSPRRSYSSGVSQLNGSSGAFTIGPSDVDSDSEYFPIPYVAKVWKPNVGSALSLTFYGRGGMNTDYSQGTATLDPDGPGPGGVVTLDGTFGNGKAGLNLSQAFLELGYAKKNGPWNLGISGIFAIQAFEARGLGAFAGLTKTFAASGGTSMPTNLTNNDHDMTTGFGVKLGLIYEASDQLNLAWAYQSEIVMGTFDDYADLFAGGGEFNIPASVRVAASYGATTELTLHFGYEYTWFSQTGAVGNQIANIFGCPTAGAGGTDIDNCLGGSNGAGFGWQDVPAYKFGVEWELDHELTLRAGYSYADQPINPSEMLFNILAPGVIEHHLTIGFSRTLASGSELSASFMFAPSTSVSGANTFDSTQTIELEMHQFEFELGYRF